MAKDTVVVKNEKQGFLSKIGNSFTGVIVGILILIGGIILLGNNEKNNVKNIKDVKELRDKIVDISSAKVDSKYEGKLVALSGKLSWNDALVTDGLFGVTAKTPKMVRVVEMYQWIETSETKDDKTTYTYSKEWAEKIDEHDNSSDTTHTNPTEMPYEAISVVTEEPLKVGDYTLIESFKDQLSATEDYKDFSNITLVEGYTVNDKYITNSVDVTNPQIGDVRISYKVADYKDVSVLGKQIDNTIGKYSTKKHSSYGKLFKGTLDANEMLNRIESGHKASKWLMRIIGSILIIMGVSMILGPITTLIGYIPFLGNIVNSMIGVVSFLVGLSIALLVIAISWFVVRPVLSIILIAIIVGLIIGIMYIKKTKATPVEKK